MEQENLDKPNQIKALFRKAKAESQLKDFNSATQDINILLALDENNEEAKKLLRDLKLLVDKDKIREQKVYGAMFGEDK